MTILRFVTFSRRKKVGINRVSGINRDVIIDRKINSGDFGSFIVKISWGEDLHFYGEVRKTSKLGRSGTNGLRSTFQYFFELTDCKINSKNTRTHKGSQIYADSINMKADIILKRFGVGLKKFDRVEPWFLFFDCRKKIITRNSFLVFAWAVCLSISDCFFLTNL